ncbi:MAG: VUT family protein [Deltaproteobacteria bacterium]|nr:VUT family protein [Deltaproteobacteria bacterium]
MTASENPADLRDPSRGELLYLFFGGVFFLALVVANVFAASKLMVIDLGFHKLVVATGIIAYPITFLITDLISEVFGKKRANAVVISGFVLSLGLLAFIEIGRDLLGSRSPRKFR